MKKMARIQEQVALSIKEYNHAVCAEYYSTQANKYVKGSDGYSKEQRKETKNHGTGKDLQDASEDSHNIPILSNYARGKPLTSQKTQEKFANLGRANI